MIKLCLQATVFIWSSLEFVESFSSYPHPNTKLNSLHSGCRLSSPNNKCAPILFSSNSPNSSTKNELDSNLFPDEISKDDERRRALQLLLQNEAPDLHIPLSDIPPIPSSLNSTFAYNKFLSTIASDLLPLHASTSTLLLTIFNFMCNKHEAKAQKPNVTTFNIVLAAFTKSNSLEKAHRFFQSIESDALKVNNINIKPNTISYNTLLNGYAHIHNTDQVLSIFQQQLQNKQTYEEAKPNLISFNTVLKAYAKSNQSEKAKALLQIMETEYDIKPDVISYTTVIDGFAQAGDAVRAENLLKSMIQKQNAIGPAEQKGSDRRKTFSAQPVPSIQTFNAVLNAWSRSKGKHGPQRAENLLTLMVEMSTSKSTKKNGINRIRIPKPNISSFNTVLNAYSRVGDGLGAEELLDSMIDNTSRLFMSNVQPDLISFNTVMSAYARSGHRKCHEDVLRIMEKMSDITVDQGLVQSPDVWTYTTLINAYTRSREKDAPYKADEVFRRMKQENVIPNVSTYNALMNAWVKSGEWGSAVRAHELLLEMIEDDSLQDPNVQTYTIVIDAYAKSREKNAAIRAQDILTFMEKQYEKTGNKNAQPNVQTYTAVINAWGRSEEGGKAQRALDILNHMKESFSNGKNDKVRPNVYTYNAVLNACAYTYGDDREKDETFRIACNVFDELRNLKGDMTTKDNRNFKANHVTYGTFLQVCARLMPKGENVSRRTIVEAIFRKCCQDGQVGAYVLNQLWEAAPNSLYWGLLEEAGIEEKILRRRAWGEDETVTVSDLPLKWTKNVRERNP